jgi:hypothetical protein
MTNSTNFINYETTIYAQWLNDVNNLVYNGNFQSPTVNIYNLIGQTGSIANLSVASLTNASLTNGQVIYAGAGGLLESNPTMRFDGTTLTVNNLVSVNGISGGSF